jgi:adenosylmethionine-8-amino-7-oxononanoate aminotransferase
VQAEQHGGALPRRGELVGVGQLLCAQGVPWTDLVEVGCLTQRGAVLHPGPVGEQRVDGDDEVTDRLVQPGVAELRDPGVICAWGRLGYWFGCERYGYVPDIMTVAKALTSAYVPMGGLVASDRVAEPFMHGDESFAHGLTFAGHPVAAAVAMANLDLFEREDIIGHVRRKEGEFREMLDSLRDIPIVGDVRGAGFFHAIELVKDQETKASFTDEESEWLLRGFLSGELFRRGLICRADDRGDPVVQLAPTLICDTEQFEEIESVLRPVLTEAAEHVRK